MLRGLLIFLLSTLFTTTLGLALHGAALQTLLYAPIYEEALEVNNAYEFLDESTPLGELSGGGSKPVVTVIIRNSLEYLRGDTNELSIDLTDTLTNYYLSQVEGLPECEQGQELFDGEKPTCIPIGFSSEEYLEFMLAQQGTTLEEASAMDLAQEFDPGGELGEARQYIIIFQQVVNAAVILTLILGLLLIYTMRNDKKKLVRTMEGDFIFTGGSMIVAAIAFRAALTQFAIPVPIPELYGVVTYIFMTVLTIMFVLGGIVAGLGLVLLIGGASVREKVHKLSKPKKVTQQPQRPSKKQRDS